MIYSFFELISNQPANSNFTIMMIALVLVSIIYFIWKSNKSIQDNNVLIAYFAILVFQIFLFVMGSLSETGGLDLSISFPIIDRLQFTFTTVLLIWMLNPFKKNLTSPSMYLSIIFIIMGFAIVSGVFWRISNTTRFNYTWIDISWELINILVVLISMVSLIRNHSKSWKLGYFLFMLLFLGLSFHFLFISQNDYYSGSIRFSQFVVMLLFPTLFNKYFDTSELTIEPTLQQEVTNELLLKTSLLQEETNPKILPEENIAQKYVSEFPKILLWLELATQDNEVELIPKLTKALATSIFQGIVLQAKIQALSNQMIITTGYDLLNNKSILPGNLTIKDNSPLTDLFGKTDPSFIALDFAQSYADINALKSFLNLGELNNIIFIPLQNEINNFGSLLIISPLNENIWQFEDHDNFDNLSELISKILLANEKVIENPSQLSEETNPNLTNSISSNLNKNDKVIDEVSLQQQDSINQSFLLSLSDREQITAVVQELRQPFSSILGYTDLIMSESAGVINALQRKFLERIKESNEKMRNLLDELIKVTSFDKKQLNFKYQPVNFEGIIDSAVSKNQELLLEKNISLRLDIQQNIPELSVDKDAMQQVLFNLINNASTASHKGGVINLSMCIKENEFDERYLLTTVEDSGGGVKEDQIEHVFSKRFVSNSNKIPGLGESGIGLTMTKTLVEAHGGRIWIDVIKDHGNQFSILLPIEH